MAQISESTVEHLTPAQLERRLASLQAEMYPERSSDKAYVYTTPSNWWLKVKDDGAGKYAVTYHTECPCHKGL